MRLSENDKKILALLKTRPLRHSMIDKVIHSPDNRLRILLSEELIGMLKAPNASLYYAAGDRQRAEEVLFSEKGTTGHIKNPEYKLPKPGRGGKRISLSKMKRQLKVIGAKV